MYFSVELLVITKFLMFYLLSTISSLIFFWRVPAGQAFATRSDCFGCCLRHQELKSRPGVTPSLARALLLSQVFCKMMYTGNYIRVYMACHENSRLTFSH